MYGFKIYNFKSKLEINRKFTQGKAYDSSGAGESGDAANAGAGEGLVDIGSEITIMPLKISSTTPHSHIHDVVTHWKILFLFYYEELTNRS